MKLVLCLRLRRSSSDTNSAAATLPSVVHTKSMKGPLLFHPDFYHLRLPPIAPCTTIASGLEVVFLLFLGKFFTKLLSPPLLRLSVLFLLEDLFLIQASPLLHSLIFLPFRTSH
ncbi:hypothetical protein NE237_024367 [Protea cynaroides]|uniref:Uncharacterized protein n=1 Tax=Protea cynaroides TaxID=273540 RepID=A0A9Q0K706_9MAGN|nr:hypothetical protein NE237_024367 [Protea cynaroides]